MRHAEISRECGHNISILSRRKNIYDKCYQELEVALDNSKPELIIIANETSIHHSTIEELNRLGYSNKILVEKPLSQHFSQEQNKNHNNIFVGYNLRFNPIISSLKTSLQSETVCTASLYVGQYLPSWRNNQDYSKSYSASKKHGGGVLRDLSHELDLSCWLFGEWTALTSLGGKFSTLDIDSEDNYSILLKTEKCKAVQIHLNYLNQEPKRQIIINTLNNTYEANLIKKTLTINGKVKSFDSEYNSTYKSQLNDVLKVVPSETCSYAEGNSIVNMIEKIEYANNNNYWVENQLL